LDGIGCFAVLEHTRRPWQVVEEMNRMLKPGGRVFIDWPFLQPTHGFPSHFFNATREGLTSLFTDNGFEIEVANTYPHQWPSFTVNWILGKLLDDLPRELSDEFRELKVGELVRREPLGEFWRRVVAAMSDDKISEFACGNSLIGTKK
jgi:SAM-dependent methyltransferase